jgi:hypothetical protein
MDTVGVASSDAGGDRGAAMTMTPGLRRFALTLHLTFSVGWIGAVGAFLALVVAAMTSQDAQTLQAAWIAMEVTGWFAIVPLALASLLTGLVMAVGTRWGLFRHYWVLVSFVLTTLACAILLGNMQSVSFFAGIASEMDSADVGALRRALPSELLHAGVGLLVLLGIQVLNVYKPRGLTPYGRRKQNEQEAVSPSMATVTKDGAAYSDADGDTAVSLRRGETTTAPRWAKVSGVIVIVLVLLFIVLHLTGHGRGGHTSSMEDGCDNEFKCWPSTRRNCRSTDTSATGAPNCKTILGRRGTSLLFPAVAIVSSQLPTRYRRRPRLDQHPP